MEDLDTSLHERLRQGRKRALLAGILVALVAFMAGVFITRASEVQPCVRALDAWHEWRGLLERSFAHPEDAELDSFQGEANVVTDRLEVAEADCRAGFFASGQYTPADLTGAGWSDGGPSGRLAGTLRPSTFPPLVMASGDARLHPPASRVLRISFGDGRRPPLTRPGSTWPGDTGPGFRAEANPPTMPNPRGGEGREQ